MSYTPLTRPRGHQFEALRRISARPSSPSREDIFALLMEYGAGKSKVICDEWGERELAGDLQDLLVVAGAGSYLNWCQDKSALQPSEFHRHLSPDLQERMRTAAWVTGQGKQAMRDLEDFIRRVDPRRPRALCVNIEALSTVKKARELVLAFLSAPGRRAMAVDDESTNIKSDEAERTRFMCDRVAPVAAARRILTGFVTPNTPMDLFSQFWFLDWRVLGHRSFYSFRSRYAILKPIEVPTGRMRPDGTEVRRTVQMEVGYRNLEELQEKIAPYSYRVLKKDCLDLPLKVYAPIRDVRLTDEQRRHYKEMRQQATTQLADESWVTATMVLKRNLRLQQLLCGFMTNDDGDEVDIPSRRGAELLEVLAEHSGKGIVWVPWHNPLQKVVRLLEKEYGPGSTAQFHGNNKDTRGEDERRWLGDPRCRWMVSTPAAGGKGNTWLPGTLQVYFANTHNLEDRLNSEDRPHRDGQTETCTIVDLVAMETNEIKTVEALREKINMATITMGDEYKEWLL